MNIVRELQQLINSIEHNTSMGECYMRASTIEGLKEAIIRYDIDKLAFENDMFYCFEKERDFFFQELKGQVYNELMYRYNFSIKNKKRIFKKLVKECVIDKIDFFIQDRKQTFFDIDKLVKLMKENDFTIEEKPYIKIKNSIYDYESNSYRSRTFKTVQSFKKWFENYIPCDINKITVKKKDNKYIVSSDSLISIPYVPTSIKSINIELNGIDAQFHRWDRMYEVTNYKEKKMKSVEGELSRLNKLLINKINKKYENHRFFHILNRNIEESERYLKEEIEIAFRKSEYDEATIREKVIYSKFFRELEIDEVAEFCETFKVQECNIRAIYESSPLKLLRGVSEIWDK